MGYPISNACGHERYVEGVALATARVTDSSAQTLAATRSHFFNRRLNVSFDFFIRDTAGFAVCPHISEYLVNEGEFGNPP